MSGWAIFARAAVLGMALAIVPGPIAASERIDLAARELLDTHNRERDRLGIAKLEWSDALSRDAQQWAEHLAQRGSLAHSSFDARNGAGENLWMGTARAFRLHEMIDLFIGEKNLYRHRPFPDVSTTGNWTDVGHYTQIVWRETRQVGCGIAEGSNGEVLVCRYYPSGNYRDQLAY